MNQAGANWHDWLPIRVWRPAGEWVVDWCRFGSQRLCEPFFSDSVEVALRHPFNLAFRQRTGIDALLDWQMRSPGIAPTAFVFHTSRCGSTLLAQVIACFDSHIVLSEPPPFDSVLRAHYSDPMVAEQQTAWIRALLSALGQCRSGSERALVVKLDAWNIFELPLLRQCFPATPWLFLYRDPLEIAVSHWQSPGRHMVPGLIGASPLALPADQAMTASRPEFVARTIGRLFEAGLEQCTQHGGLLVNYNELPEVIGGRLSTALGLDAADATSARYGLRHHAKRPGETFEQDSSGKREAAEDAVRKQVERWALQPYVALERLRARQRVGAKTRT